MSARKYEIICKTEALPISVYTLDKLRNHLETHFPDDNVDSFLTNLEIHGEQRLFFKGHEVIIAKITYH